MPGCIFQVVGREFDVDAFLAEAGLRAYMVWHTGESVAPAGPRASQRHETSGFRCNVSDVDGDLAGQIDDAIRFLTTHQSELQRLAGDSAIEDCRLDFGFDCRLGRGVAVQGEWLPADFLKLAGTLNVGVALSLYPSGGR